MAPDRTLRILCFGDSLTDGYCYFGTEQHPYSLRLRERLEAVPELVGTAIEIVTDGLPGDMVSYGRFVSRMKLAWKNKSFDWTISLGGTNDLGSGIPAHIVLNGLRSLWDIPLSRNSRVLALTVPECHVKSTKLDQQRNEINEAILGHKHPNYFAFDLRARIPYASLTEEQRDTYWNDGLHLTPSGYDWMGDHIADALLSTVLPGQYGHLATVVGSGDVERGKAGGLDAEESLEYDDLASEEEEGDSRSLSQGYIIVRKADLD